MTFRVDSGSKSAGNNTNANPCYRCVSMMGEEGCAASLHGPLQKTVCAVNHEVTVLASDSPTYLHLVPYM